MQGRLPFLVTLVLAGALALAGCGGDSPGSSPTSSPTSQGQTASARFSEPKNIQIPSIKVDSTIVPIQMDKKQVLDVANLDAKPMTTGWFDQSAKPGQIGPLVLAAHVNYNGPGAFSRLHELKPGAKIVIGDAQDQARTYVVTRVFVQDKAKFPTNDVYGRVNASEIRLITCGGAFDTSRRVGASRGSYRDNVIVFGKLV